MSVSFIGAKNKNKKSRRKWNGMIDYVFVTFWVTHRLSLDYFFSFYFVVRLILRGSEQYSRSNQCDYKLKYIEGIDEIKTSLTLMIENFLFCHFFNWGLIGNVNKYVNLIRITVLYVWIYVNFFYLFIVRINVN